MKVFLASANVKKILEMQRILAEQRPGGGQRQPQQQQGGAYKRKDDIFRMAQANKAFAHYLW